ncbi:MAG: helix-turn-helix domain-containing protein [Halorientalis sp.]
MPSGIRATVEFSNPGLCPVAAISSTTETTIDSVSTNVCGPDCTRSVTEFSTESALESPEEVSAVFSSGSLHRYRFVHDGDVSCPCECLGQWESPVARYVATEGTVTIVFHAADYEQLQTIVGDLRERFPEMDIKRFVRSTPAEVTRDTVLVDRGDLTARQLEVLRTAYDMGYFERPRRANATEVAAELEIDPSTFSEHLAAAESKLFDDLL